MTERERVMLAMDALTAIYNYPDRAAEIAELALALLEATDEAEPR